MGKGSKDSEGEWASQFWLDDGLDKEEFVEAFRVHFPGGEAEHLPLVSDAKPNQQLFHLFIPLERKRELLPFLDQYAKDHKVAIKEKPADGYPFSLYP